jgi:hypothetical protein
MWFLSLGLICAGLLNPQIVPESLKALTRYLAHHQLHVRRGMRTPPTVYGGRIERKSPRGRCLRIRRRTKL